MAAAEDDEDVSALRGARAEAAKDADQEDFDENAPLQGEEEEDDTPKDPSAPAPGAVVALAPDSNAEERDMEAEFASWQAKVGPDFRALESALRPVERFALRFRTDVEPYYSIFFINEQQRLVELKARYATPYAGVDAKCYCRV